MDIVVVIMAGSVSIVDDMGGDSVDIEVLTCVEYTPGVVDKSMLLVPEIDVM